METSLMDLMYKAPSDNTIRKAIITKEAVEGTGEPEIIYGEAPAAQPSARRNSRSRKRQTGNSLRKEMTANDAAN